MTDLQVKYQQLQHDKAVLEEDKRYHDAQIAKLAMDTHLSGVQSEKVRSETSKVDAETTKILAEYGLTLKDLEYYDRLTGSKLAKTSAEIRNLDTSSDKMRSEVDKILAEYQLRLKDLEYYDSDKSHEYHESVSSQANDWMSGIGSILKGVGSIIPL